MEVEMRSKCEDCGNQAKKGCEYKRCRSCCNNKGFKCETHVHSTWVPLYNRRRHTFPNKTTQNHYPYQQPDDDEREGMKFPERVSMKAMFRFVQVRSKDDCVNEFAYHTSVRIGGHLFSGLLHPHHHADFGDTSSSFPHHHHHNSNNNNNNLIGAAAAATATLMAPPLISSPSSSAPPPDAIFHYPTTTYNFPLPAAMSYPHQP